MQNRLLRAPLPQLAKAGRYDRLRVRQGLTIASAGTLPVPSGGYFEVSGTSNIADLPNLGGGNLVTLRFQGTLAIIHSSNLRLPGLTDLVTSANDLMRLWEVTPGTWVCLAYVRDSGAPIIGGKLLQSITSTLSTVLTGTTTVPGDDTIPQNTEGFAISALDTIINPIDDDNVLRIEAEIFAQHSTTVSTTVVALFRDSVADALKVGYTGTGSNIQGSGINVTHDVVAGSVSSTTFKVRAGANAAGTLTINGQSGARLFGGVMLSRLTVSEIAA